MKCMVVVGVFVAACGGGNGSNEEPGVVASVSVSGEPVEAVVGVALPPITVTLRDASGRATDGMVAIELASATDVISLAGATTALSSGGVAVFEELLVSMPITDVRFVARVGALDGASSGFDVVYGPPAAASAWTFSATSAIADGVTTIDGEVTIVNAGGVPIPDLPLTIQISGALNDAYPRKGKTDASGRFRSALSSATAGAKSVVAVGGGGQVTGAITFTAPPCTPLLPGLPVQLLTGAPLAIVTTDLDADGRVDLAIAETTTVTVMRGIGDGRFKPPTRYPSGAMTSSIAAADVDGDGDPDLIATSRDSDSIRIFTNQGDAQFVAGATLTTVRPQAVAAADLDGNASIDLLVRDSANVIVYLGSGSGQFQTGIPYSLALGGLSVTPGRLELRDMTADGKLDVVTSSGNGTVHVLAGNGNGTFQPVVNTNTAVDSALAIADFDEDTKLDFAVSAEGGPRFYRGNGDGTFTMSGLIEGERGQLAAHDVNGDGHQDLVTTFEVFTVVLGNGNGTFQAAERLASANLGMDLRLADVDNDGDLDAVTAQGTASPGVRMISVRLANATGFTGARLTHVRFPDRTNFLFGLGDFDGNGTTDFLGRHSATQELSVRLASANGTLTPAPSIVASGTDPSIADFNNDGKLDLLFDGGLTVRWLRGEGNGQLQAPVSSNVAIGLRPAVADLNADGILDVAGSTFTPQVNIAFGTGMGTFGTPAAAAVAAEPSSTTAADLDADGDLDLLVTSPGTVSVLKNLGNGTFAAAIGNPLFGVARDVAVADFNKDGMVDFVTGDIVREELHFFAGNGDGTFDPEVRLTVPFYIDEISAVDLDGDSNMDIVAGSVVFLGRGDGTFRPLLYDGGPGRGRHKDLDLDGRPDVVVFPDAGLVRMHNAGCL